MNRKHHQVTKTPKKVSRNSGGCWKFTSPAFLWGSVGSKGVGEDNQTNPKVTRPQEMYSAVKAGRKVSSTSSNLRVIQQLALFVSKPQLARDLFDPMLRAKSHTVGECTIWGRCEHAVAVHQWCMLFPTTSWRSLTGCRPGWAAGGNSTPGCCLWPHYNCHPIWDPEPACVNLSPIGAVEQHVDSGTGAFTPTQWLPPQGFHRIPLHVHPWRSRPKRKPSYCAAVFLYLYFDQMADTVLLPFISSELHGLDDG